MIRADGSDDGEVARFVNPGGILSGWARPDREIDLLATDAEARLDTAAALGRVATDILTRDEGGRVSVRRGGLTYDPLSLADNRLTIGNMEFRETPEPGTYTNAVEVTATNVGPELLAVLTGTARAERTWRYPDCGDDCSQMGSGSVYHCEEVELSNGDSIDINYRVAPNQATQLVGSPDLIHRYLRRIVERERTLAEDHLADREMLRRRMGN